MRKLTAFLFGVFVTGALGANCQTIHPPEGKGTSYPCGVWGVECIEGTCCPYKHDCGGHKGYFTTCPEGYCCYTGDDDWPSVGAGADAGASETPHRKMSIVKARPAK